MNHNRRTAAILLAAMLSAGCLTSCGGEMQQAADTRSMIAEQSAASASEDMRGDLNGDGLQDVADAQLLVQYYVENTIAGNEISWEQLLGAASSERADKAAAERVVKNYLEAAKAGDTLGVIEYSGLGDMMRLTSGYMKTNEELAQEEGLKVNKIDSYTIGEPRTDAAMLSELQSDYEKAFAEARAVVENKQAGASELRTAFLTLTLLRPITKLYVYPVSITVDGKTEEEELLITCDEKGAWNMDGGIAASLVRYIAKSRKAVANNAAKSLYNALNASLTMLDEKDVDVRLLDGDYTLTGADFAGLEQQQNIGRSSTKNQVLAELKYQAAQFYDAVKDLKAVSFRIKNGVCVAVAMEKESGDSTLIGAYPLMSEIPDGLTVTEVMQKAAERG